MTLVELQKSLEKLQNATGKTCRAYICGPNTYKNALNALGLSGKETGVVVMGVNIYVSPYAPDSGAFYPADYLESMPSFPCDMGLL